MDDAASEKTSPSPDLLPAETYWLARFWILRLLGFVFTFAFLTLAFQFKPLLGSEGLLPIGDFLDRASEALGGTGKAAGTLPSIFWLGHSDGLIQTLAWIGVGLSLLLLAGYANVVLLAVLWVLYLSIYHVGQLWYGYGWETQTLETTALAIFLVPFLRGGPFPKGQPPSLFTIWLFRWLLFRMMIGAGLIKLRGDDVWTDLTALFYHFETQPIPNPVSWYLHHLPQWFLKLGVVWNHVVELILPWLLLIPAEIPRAPTWLKKTLRVLILIAGVNMAAFQLFLIGSGNLSFLNWLTLIPCLACFDDQFLGRFTPGFVRNRIMEAQKAEPRWPRTRFGFAAGYTAIVLILSVPVIQNLFFSRRQAMNTSYNRLHLVNTYGAFGSVGKKRYEIIVEGTANHLISSATEWREYEFPGKPGRVDRRPPFIAPYQPRIGWQIWFAAMSRPEREDWMIRLIQKLLEGNPQTHRLLAENPFPDPENPPKWIRCSFYEYRFTTPEERRETGDWWIRKRLGAWLRPLKLN